MSSLHSHNGSAVADAPVASRGRGATITVPVSSPRRSAPSRVDEAASMKIAELEAVVAAIGKSQAVIEFKLDGTILHCE